MAGEQAFASAARPLGSEIGCRHVLLLPSPRVVPRLPISVIGKQENALAPCSTAGIGPAHQQRRIDFTSSSPMTLRRWELEFALRLALLSPSLYLLG
jgi:hypothetical protein